LIAVLACHSDRHESFYASLADADKDGAITRGWIPTFLPQSSRAIHELHDLSPSREWCAFEFRPSDSQSLRKNIKSVDALTPSVRRVPPPGVSWWPAVLKGNDLDLRQIHEAGFDVYELVIQATTDSKAVQLFAIDWSKGRGFFYEVPAYGGE
jgi:hypothetical protein